MSRSRASRIARAGVAASIATFAALMSHVAAGGTLPDALGIIVPLLLALPVCLALAGRSLSLLRLSFAVGISQMLFHVLFVVGAPSASPLAAHGTHAHGYELITVFAPESGASAATEALPVLLMTAAHAFAAAVTIAALYRGERAVGSLRVLSARVAVWFRRVVAVTLALPLVPRTLRLRALFADTTTLHALLLTRVVPRRGPPRFA